jgi:hypothetical protein
MKCLSIHRVAAAAVMLCAAITIAGAPAAADPLCGPRTVSVSDASRDEGGNQTGTELSFTISSNGCAAARVSYQTTAEAFASPTAIPGVDYTPVSGTINWVIGDTGDRVITVDLIGDVVAEDVELFAFEVVAISGATIVDGEGVGTIRNDDHPKIELELAGETDSEPDCEGQTGTCDLLVIITTPADKNVTVHYGTVDGTAMAGQDYNGIVRGSVTIPAGRTSAISRVTIRPDRIMAQHEYFYLRIFEPSLGQVMISQRRVLIPMR